jgi:HTH-type transcriptional repressor of NAD biosynthesis genes
MSKIGVTVGKFMPLHKGHELMIEMAASQLDELIVIVSSEPRKHSGMIFNLDHRYNIIKEKYAGRNITVVKYSDDIGDPIEVDVHGTATDNSFWESWINVFKIFAPDATHFVSSDRYGKQAAKRLGITWLAIDPDRELVDISATRIRANPMKEWQYIAKEFRPDYAKTIVVVGPESCGKSTLVKDLGKAWGSPAVPEYGRIMTEIIGDGAWHLEHFYEIVRRQQAMNKIAAQQSTNGLVFIDTEAYTTALYALEYLNENSETLRSISISEQFDLVIVVSPDLPWVDDGSRVMPDQDKRQEFFEMLLYWFHLSHLNTIMQPLSFCTVSNRVYDNAAILRETDRVKRVTFVSAKVSEMLAAPKEYDISHLT